MSNYNFTPTLNGLNNIEAHEIRSNSITTSNLTGNLTNAVLTNCTTSADPISSSNIANKNYIQRVVGDSSGAAVVGALKEKYPKWIPQFLFDLMILYIIIYA